MIRKIFSFIITFTFLFIILSKEAQAVAPLSGGETTPTVYKVTLKKLRLSPDGGGNLGSYKRARYGV